MKSFLLLSVVALTLQGIIMNPYDRRYDNQQPTNEIINQRPFDPIISSADSNLINQRPVEPVVTIKDNNFINQRPIMNNDVVQRPIYTQPIQPIMNQTPFVTPTPIVNQIPIIKHEEMENRPYIGYVRPPVINLQQPLYPQPISTIGIVNPTSIPVVPISTPMTNNNIIYQNKCRVDGKYGQLCVRSNIFLTRDVIENAPYHKRYRCLKKAICGFKDNKCQWFQTRDFKRCLRRVIYEREINMNTRRMTFLGA